MSLRILFINFVFSLGDPSIDWEESVYLNLILHQVSEVAFCEGLSSIQSFTCSSNTCFLYSISSENVLCSYKCGAQKFEFLLECSTGYYLNDVRTHKKKK